MKVLMLADHTSAHTLKWVNGLAGKGVEILLFSLSSGSMDQYANIQNLKSKISGKDMELVRGGSGIKKLSYLKELKNLKIAIKEFSPDILHAHYASSYGLLGALSGFHPYVLSVWGSDVYDFPNNLISRSILKFNLSRADKILSTSHVMAKETSKYASKKIEITPFGIDTDKFQSNSPETQLFPESAIVIGTIKALEPKYGIEYLIKAFKLLQDEFKDEDLRLLIVGRGSQEIELKKMCSDLGIENKVVFTGRIKHELVPDYMNMLDVYVALSTLDSESFGVAILEASSCEIPVVVSNVGGLPEVVAEGETGFVVPKNDPESAYLAIKNLVQDKNLRTKLGQQGRERVLKNYEWTNCVGKMIKIYSAVIPE